METLVGFPTAGDAEGDVVVNVVEASVGLFIAVVGKFGPTGARAV